MLATLSIRDVVLIDRLDLAFEPGLCALTGETGAGKSILLDALGLALGARAEARLVRHGAERAVVTAAFDAPASAQLAALFAEHGLDASLESGESPAATTTGGADSADGHRIVLRRVLSADGRSRAFVNDQPVGVALLKAIGEQLVEIHGQFESQRLLDAAAHRDLLDAFGGHAALRAATAEARRVWREAEQAHAAAVSDLAAARRDEEWLRHATDALAALAPTLGEEQTLSERRTLLMGAEKLLQAMDEAARDVGGGVGVSGGGPGGVSGGGRGVDATLRSAVRVLQRVAGLAEGRLDPAIAALDRAASEAEEAMAQLERAAAELDLDPRQLEAVEERLFALRAAARKHDVPVDALPDLLAALRARLAAVEDGSDAVARLAADLAAARAAYESAAGHLTAARRTAAARLDAAVAGELEPLRLAKARFLTRIAPLPEREWGDAGVDQVEFEVATNPGAPPGPLARIASGGEIARFMLALKVVLARADPVPTLVFDEVDAGIGGAVAAAVGERLARLAEDVQVLVVTHSPQVAARGAAHWRVAKAAEGERTRTFVDVLGPGERTEEIARMLAGARVTDEARAAAGRLLQGAE
jgi:DNA repair protein RecN (Recombination protein N)